MDNVMTEGEKVSVVMCTYNGARFLKAQLDSIIQQTYPIHELIIQDDDSTDCTWDILLTYAHQYPFIKLFHNDIRKGVNCNFLSAMRRATGDYIAISDQDDIWRPQKIEWQVNNIEDAWLSAGISRPFSEEESAEVSFDNRKTNLCLERTIYCSMIAGHTMMFRREFLEKLPESTLWIDRFMYDHVLQMVAEAYEKLSFINQVLVDQRRYVGATTYTEPINNDKTIKNMLSYAQRTFNYYKNPKIREGMDLHFHRIHEFLSAIPSQTSSWENATRLAFLHSRHSIISRIRLTCLCVKIRDKIFHTKEKNKFLSIVRALYFPISCCDYFRYLE